jgi:hypothetical protein
MIPKHRHQPAAEFLFLLLDKHTSPQEWLRLTRKIHPAIIKRGSFFDIPYATVLNHRIVRRRGKPLLAKTPIFDDHRNAIIPVSPFPYDFTFVQDDGPLTTPVLDDLTLPGVVANGFMVGRELPNL